MGSLIDWVQEALCSGCKTRQTQVVNYSLAVLRMAEVSCLIGDGLLCIVCSTLAWALEVVVTSARTFLEKATSEVFHFEKDDRFLLSVYL